MRRRVVFNLHRLELLDTPLPNPDLVLYVEGSASCNPCFLLGGLLSLPSHYSAQAAELVALTCACILAAGKSVTIYTDSRFAFSVVHDFGTLWRHRGF